MESLCILSTWFRLLLIFGLLSIGFVAAGTVYNVGGSSGWDISTDMKSWEQDKTFYVGDTLWFQFSSYESLVELTKPNFDACNTTNYISRDSSGNVTITLTSTGERYFASGNRLYCLGGLKLDAHTVTNLTATAGSPAAAPSGVPASPLAGTSKSNNNNPVSSSATANRLNLIVVMGKSHTLWLWVTMVVLFWLGW